MKKGTIHIVDDDPAVRKALKLLVSSTEHQANEYEDGWDFLNRYAPAKPECLLLDLRMPGMDGLTVQRELRKRGIKITTVFLSGHGDIPVAVQALLEGAMDFVEKPFDNEHLLERLQVGVETDAGQERARIDVLNARERLENLSERERQVVDLLVAGKINKVIAAELGISTRTVESHRARVMRKVGVKSLSDLIKIVLAGREETDGKALPG